MAVGTGTFCCSAWRSFAAEEAVGWLLGERFEERKARGWHAGKVLRWITIVCVCDGVVGEEVLDVSVGGRDSPVLVGGMTGVEDAVWWRLFEEGAPRVRMGSGTTTKHARS